MSLVKPLKTRQKALKPAGLVVLSVFLSLFSSFACAEWQGVSGHLKGLASVYQYEERPLGLTDNPASLSALDLRLKTAYESLQAAGAWQLNLDYQLQAQTGSQTEYGHFIQPWQNPDKTQWLNLTQTLVDEPSQRVWQRLDRMNLGYVTESYAIKVGRQALSWGRGNAFNPMDLFNPFAPNTVDTEYKPGTDMVNLQWLMASGNEWTAILVPRRDVQTGELTQAESSAAIKGNFQGERLEWQWMLAQDYQDQVVGVSLSGELWDGAWNWDWVPTYVNAERWVASSVLNFSRAFELANRVATGFVEFYYNGFGETAKRPIYSELNADLMTKLQRSQVFVVNRHYWDAGLTMEWTPLVNLTGSWLQNAQDLSGLLNLAMAASLSDQTQLLAGVQRPFGEKGTEFGGLYLNALTNQTMPTALHFYLQLNGYF